MEVPVPLPAWFTEKVAPATVIWPVRAADDGFGATEYMRIQLPARVLPDGTVSQSTLLDALQLALAGAIVRENVPSPPGEPKEALAGLSAAEEGGTRALTSRTPMLVAGVPLAPV